MTTIYSDKNNYDYNNNFHFYYGHYNSYGNIVIIILIS